MEKPKNIQLLHKKKTFKKNIFISRIFISIGSYRSLIQKAVAEGSEIEQHKRERFILVQKLWAKDSSIEAAAACSCSRILQEAQEKELLSFPLVMSS